ncbi:MmyB family transcriptional regulator [Nocardia sp. NPDC055029]
MTEGTAPSNPGAKHSRRRAVVRPHVSIPNLALTLRWIRDDLRLTQRQAASQIGFSEIHLGRFETGKSKPPPESLEQIISGYRVNKAMAAHLRELAGRAIPLAPATALRAYVRAEKSLMLNLDRFQARAVPAAFIDPFCNVLACNDVFTAALPGIDDGWSIPLWMFSDQRDAVVDPEAEGAWSVSILKATLGRHRDSEQARELVTGLEDSRWARRLWAASLAVATGRDARSPMHARDARGNLVSYQLALTEGLPAHHIQLVTATPEPYTGPSDIS